MPANADVTAFEEILDEVKQPVFVRATVVVSERDNFARGGIDPRVAGGGEALVALPQAANGGECAGDFRRAVRRAIVHDDDLIIRVVQPRERIQACLQNASAVVTGDDHGNLRRPWEGKTPRPP